MAVRRGDADRRAGGARRDSAAGIPQSRLPRSRPADGIARGPMPNGNAPSHRDSATGSCACSSAAGWRCGGRFVGVRQGGTGRRHGSGRCAHDAAAASPVLVLHLRADHRAGWHGGPRLEGRPDCRDRADGPAHRPGPGRGGRLRYFFWCTGNVVWLRRRLWRGGYYVEARDAVWDFVTGLRLPYYWWLGFRGFVGGLPLAGHSGVAAGPGAQGAAARLRRRGLAGAGAAVRAVPADAVRGREPLPRLLRVGQPSCRASAGRRGPSASPCS